MIVTTGARTRDAHCPVVTTIVLKGFSVILTTCFYDTNQSAEKKNPNYFQFYICKNLGMTFHYIPIHVEHCVELVLIDKT